MILISTMVYALGKELGLEAAAAEFYRQLGEPTNESLPCVRTIHRLRALGHTVGLRLDCNSVSIGKARSRAFHEAEAQQADIWVMVDDDVEADTRTIENLLLAVSGDEPALCLAPYVLREANVVSVAIHDAARPRLLDSGAITWPCKGGGLGMAAINRAGIRKLALAYASKLGYVDGDGVHRLALFQEMLVQGDAQWLGEDVSFCRRCEDVGMRVEALGTGHVKHAGQTLQLDVVRPPAKA